ncbi:MAG: FHA domain-containing protein [Deltaproteobacteria bacterium]|nr:FHA domain-containing protein [Deltaproteobacteria bacterium]
MPKLIVINGPTKGRSFDLNAEALFIGRSSINDIQIKDKAISRKQLKIFSIGNKFFAEDLKSTNGTYINGKIITPGEGFELSEGDTISIGNTFIRLCEVAQANNSISKKIPVRHSTGLSNKRERPLNDRRDASGSFNNLNLLYKISELLRQPISIDEICEKVLEFLLANLPRIDLAAIFIFDKEKEQTKKVISRSRGNNERDTDRYSRSIVDRVLRNGKALRMSNTRFEAPCDLSHTISARKIASVLCVPMISNSKLIGAIYMDSVQGPYGFRKNDLMLLNTVSGSLAVTIEKAKLVTILDQLKKSNRSRV